MTATNTVLIAILIAMLQPNCNLNNVHKVPNYNENVHIIIYILDAISFSAKIAAISLIEIEYCHKRFMQRNLNSIAHAKNGNRLETKTKSHLKYMAINKGNSNFKTNKNLMINLVNKRSPDVLVISEANLWF